MFAHIAIESFVVYTIALKFLHAEYIMAILRLAAQPREKLGSRACRALRRQGFIPANLYSHGEKTTSLQLDQASWSKALSEETHLIMLQMPDGKAEMAALREIQRDPMTQQILHIDLLRVKMDEHIHFSVKVEYTGTPKGVKEGGVCQIFSEHVEVECLPSQVPDFLKIDISGLRIGDSLSARDIVLPEGIKLITGLDTALVSVTAVRMAEAAKGPAEAETVEKSDE